MNPKAKISESIVGMDFVDIESESDKVILTLNWERLIVNKKTLKSIEFKFKGGVANEILIHLDTMTMEVPVNLTIEEAFEIEIKSRKITHQ